MLAALTHSDLSVIHDLAVARSRIDHADAARPGEGSDAVARLFATIARLDPAAMAELAALVHVGRHGRGTHDWSALVLEARAGDGERAASRLALIPDLDALIERGLIALREHAGDECGSAAAE